MSETADTAAAIAEAPDWDRRVALVRQIPEAYGIAAHREIYASLARQLYVPQLTPDFAYVHWREPYELDTLAGPYQAARDLTEGFTKVSTDDLAAAVRSEARTTVVWRLLVGYTRKELAAATVAVVAELGSDLRPISETRVERLEQGKGRAVSGSEAQVIAEVTARAIEGTLWPPVPDGRRTKQQRPDLVGGWESIRTFARQGVPLVLLLHQRLYGGSFRQVLDATSTERGDSLERALVEELDLCRIPYLRTGAHDQSEIRTRFNITIQPAPDFVFFDQTGALRAMLEAKLTNDGGTARDKASRFAGLRRECQRLGGLPLFALVDGLGWARAADALGPVIRDCDGRVFTRATLTDMFEVDPFPMLMSVLQREGG